MSARFEPGVLLVDAVERTVNRFAGRVGLSARRGISTHAIEYALNQGFADVANVLFVGSDVPSPDVMARWWAPLAGNFEEDLVVGAVQVLDPTIDRVVYAPTGGLPSCFGGWFVKRSGDDSRTPIGGFGEGTKRLLGLSMALANCAKGVLLLDEVENGIHYSVQPKLWRFLVEAARKLDVQVFATTHSKDVLEALSEVHRESPELASDVSVHRLEAGRPDAVRFDAARIAELIELDLEAR